MRAVQYVEHGGPEVLRVVDVAEPHAGPGQVRIEVKAVGVNPVDWKLRQGPAADGTDASRSRSSDDRQALSSCCQDKR